MARLHRDQSALGVGSHSKHKAMLGEARATIAASHRTGLDEGGQTAEKREREEEAERPVQSQCLLHGPPPVQTAQEDHIEKHR